MLYSSNKNIYTAKVYYMSSLFSVVLCSSLWSAVFRRSLRFSQPLLLNNVLRYKKERTLIYNVNYSK